MENTVFAGLYTSRPMIVLIEHGGMGISKSWGGGNREDED